MRVVAPVLRRAFVGEGLVETDVVGAHAVDAVRHANNQRKHAQIANDGSDRDIHNVIAETSPVRPASGYQSAVLERILDLALKQIGGGAEDAQSREAGIIRIRGMRWAAPCKAHALRREVDLDQVGDIDGRDIGPLGCYGRRIQRRNQEGINQGSKFWIKRILAKELIIHGRAGAAVKVLVHDGDEAFVEERVALASDLHPRRGGAVLLLIAPAAFSQHGDLLTTGCCINTDDLLVTFRPSSAIGMLNAMRWRLKPPCESIPGFRRLSRSKMELISA